MLQPHLSRNDTVKIARILIIEDEPIIALDLQDLLVEAGFDVVGIAARLDAALAMIDRTEFDGAIVDANLGGLSSDPAASAITARGLPLIVLSGYSLKQKRALFPRAHFIQKPCRPEQLITALKQILTK